MNNLTKSDLINNMKNNDGLSKKDNTSSLDAIISTITNTLAKGNGVRFIGFGTFKVSHRSARKGRNPQTGKSMTISARNVPQFKAGQSLKKSVNK